MSSPNWNVFNKRLNDPQFHQPPEHTPIILPQRGVPDSPTGVSQKRYVRTQGAQAQVPSNSSQYYLLNFELSTFCPKAPFILKPYFTISNAYLIGGPIIGFNLANAALFLSRISDGIILWSNSPVVNTQPALAAQASYSLPDLDSDIFVDFDPSLNYLQNMNLFTYMTIQNSTATPHNAYIDLAMSYDLVLK